MATNTANLGLKKPAYTDPVDVQDFNNNFQKIDDSFGNLSNPVYPSMMTGTNDHDKLQNAINTAISQNREIILDRVYDITGFGSLIIDKTLIPTGVSYRTTLHFFGGGIKKTDSGSIFTANTASTGDVTFNHVNFHSTAGSGTKVFDASKLIRIQSIGCDYRNVDSVISTPDQYIQSYRIIGGSIVGGNGNAIETPGAFDLQVTNVLVENRQNFFTQFKGTTSSFSSLYNVAFRDVCVEALTGTAYTITNTTQLTIDGGYYESNAVGDIVFDSSGIYVGVYISNIRSQLDTNPDSRAIIVWGGQIQTAKVFNVVGVGLPVNDTTNVTLGNIFSEGEKKQAGGGSASLVNIDTNNRLVRYPNAIEYTSANNVSVSQLGMFRRIKTSLTKTLTTNAQTIAIVDLKQPIYTDDIISIQTIRPQALSQEIILESYNKNGNTVEIWFKNNYTSDVSVTVHVTVLQPFYSVTG